MMHKDWIKYDEWVYGFIKQKLKNKNDTQTLRYFKKTIGDIYNNKSIQLITDGHKTKSLEYTIKALKIYEEVDDKWRVSSGYSNMGNYYQEIDDFETAFKYYNKGLEIAKKAKDLDNVAICLLSLGSLYEDQKEYNKALINYEKSFEYAKEYGDITRYPLYLDKIGNVYEIKGAVEKALACYEESLRINEEVGYVEGMSNSLNHIAYIQIEKDNINEAYKLASKSFKLSQELSYPTAIKISSELMSRIYEKQGKGMEALKMFKLFVKMADSLSREEENAQTVRVQAKYEYEKQKAIDDAENDKLLVIEQEEKEKQQILTAAAAGGLGLVVVFLIFVFNRLRVTKKQKLLIEEQKEKVEQQKEEVEKAHKELEEKNREITDSITYAKRIQSAILPPAKVVKEYLKESFILYKPKDIVAGDFYWMEHKNDKVLFAAADCTGHGVPGAMVSVVCNNALNRSVREHGLTDPGKILTKTREIVIQEFEKSAEEVKDGMDIALCSLEGDKLQYAGAHNPLWIIRNGEILETKANKQPIGKTENQEPYTTHSFNLQKGDSIYLFSDGYVDQFGGKKGKKLKSKTFRELLLSIQDKSMEEQKIVVNEAFETWRGNLEQIDDVCVIGVRI